ncbi:MAG TPA: hypothetical protein VE093_49740 [Polyangiaceae bacterium]|nr:hypothetical protein [Polyangiaceae bacterium]
MIAQTLHGYDQGHRLLALGGNVNDHELAALDRLSDLSGYLPLGTEFDRYHTGFACGRYYAFACTWPDTSALRAGTVLTHTLLVPQDWLARVSDLWSLSAWHRRPASAADRAPYTSAIEMDLGGQNQGVPAINRDRAEASVVLWFGQPDRPVLWVEENRPEDVVRYLWMLLWAEARQQFAFCTLSLQVRHVHGRPFGFLALPPSARGSFHERSGSAAWWQGGQLTNPGLREAQRQPWVQTIVDGGARTTLTMPLFCREQQLSLLDAPDLLIFHRFIELEAPAKVRLTAARARADLLVRLWPSATPRHPLVREVLRGLLERQGEAPLEPRPFWELRDFLDRPLVKALCGFDSAFASSVHEVLTSELLRRLSAPKQDVTEHLVAWLRSETDTDIRAALRKALKEWLQTRPVERIGEERGAVLLGEAASADDVALVEAILEMFETAGRRALLERAATMADGGRPALYEITVTAAKRLGDAGLGAFAWYLRGDPLEGLREATRIVLAQPNPQPAMIEPIVQSASAANRLRWSLEVTAPILTGEAASLGAAAAAEQGIPWPDLVEQCRDAPNGLGVLLARALRFPSPEVRKALESAGPLAPALLKRALHCTGSGAISLVAAATEVLPEASLFSVDMAAELDAAWEADGARGFAEVMAPRIVSQLVSGRWQPGSAAAWLGARPVQEAIERSSEGTLFSRAHTLARSDQWLPNIARGIFEYADGKEGPVTTWFPALLERPLKEASADSLAAAEENLLSILRLPLRAQVRERLSAVVLRTVRQTKCRRGCHRLVERTFPVVYPRLLGDKDWPWRFVVSSWSDGWDLAKAWRHWLLDTWIAAEWPPEGLLRCLEGNRDLLRRVAHRAKKRWEGREFLRRLRRTLGERGKLATDWERTAARILDELGDEIDYD